MQILPLMHTSLVSKQNKWNYAFHEPFHAMLYIQTRTMQLVWDWMVANYKNHMLDILISSELTHPTRLHKYVTNSKDCVNTEKIFVLHWAWLATFCNILCHVSRVSWPEVDWLLPGPGAPGSLSGGNLRNCHTERLTHNPLQAVTRPCSLTCCAQWACIPCQLLF